MKRLLINTYTPSEVRIWCRLFWSKSDDLDIEELQEDLIQYDFEPPKPPKEKTLSQLLREDSPLQPGKFGVTPEPEFRLPEHIPPWYFYDIQETGLRDVIDPGRTQNWGDDFDSWAFWALEHGIAPMQHFLLSIPKPYYPPPNYYGEYDGPEYEHDVIDRLPCTDEKALVRWERYLKSFGWEIPCLERRP